MKNPLPHILLDEEIHPRERIDPRRIALFVENIRDGFTFDPIEVQPHPGNYRILDCLHRWNDYKATGVTEPEVIIKDLNGAAPSSMPHKRP